MKSYSINKVSVVSDIFETEAVLIDLDSGNYYSYRGLGLYLWKMLDYERSKPTLLEALKKIYAHIDSITLKTSLDKTLKELESENLIVVSEVPKNIVDEVQSEILFDNKHPLKFEDAVLEKYTDMQDFLLIDPIHEVDYENWPKKKEKGEAKKQ